MISWHYSCTSKRHFIPPWTNEMSFEVIAKNYLQGKMPKFPRNSSVSILQKPEITLPRLLYTWLWSCDYLFFNESRQAAQCVPPATLQGAAHIHFLWLNHWWDVSANQRRFLGSWDDMYLLIMAEPATKRDDTKTPSGSSIIQFTLGCLTSSGMLSEKEINFWVIITTFLCCHVILWSKSNARQKRILGSSTNS